MTSVLMITSVSVDMVNYRPGQTYSIDDTLAAQWIANAWASVPPTPATGDPTLCIQFNSAISAITGANSLETLTTVAQTVPQVVSFDVAGEPHEWELIVGSNASDGVTYQRPTDYSAGAPRVWRRRG